jgi:hypothetical protein
MIEASSVRLGALITATLRVLALTTLPRTVCAQQAVVRGIVFADANGNGVRDASE